MEQLYKKMEKMVENVCKLVSAGKKRAFENIRNKIY